MYLSYRKTLLMKKFFSLLAGVALLMSCDGGDDGSTTYWQYPAIIGESGEGSGKVAYVVNHKILKSDFFNQFEEGTTGIVDFKTMTEEFGQKSETEVAVNKWIDVPSCTLLNEDPGTAIGDTVAKSAARVLLQYNTDSILFLNTDLNLRADQTIKTEVYWLPNKTVEPTPDPTPDGGEDTGSAAAYFETKQTAATDTIFKLFVKVTRESSSGSKADDSGDTDTSTGEIKTEHLWNSVNISPLFKAIEKDSLSRMGIKVFYTVHDKDSNPIVVPESKVNTFWFYLK